MAPALLPMLFSLPSLALLLLLLLLMQAPYLWVCAGHRCLAVPALSLTCKSVTEVIAVDFTIVCYCPLLAISY